MNNIVTPGSPPSRGLPALPRLGAFIGLAHGLVEIEQISFDRIPRPLGASPYQLIHIPLVAMLGF
jgi:hypothetical protein